MQSQSLEKELVNVLRDIARELKSINKNLEVVSQDIKKKNIENQKQLLK